ncbi:MAG TPA: sigma-70 family RNA polymerase sigma factor, partial [Gemmataceae bacterium]|nr:sigma-70 family RNA polymerase sigma factor [Gemmataceae bacterium]
MAMAQSGMLLHYLHRLTAGSGAPASDRQLLDDFVQRGDEAAFTALVARHGPMVLRVCRRVLGQEHDAEDAFQATFLVLAQHGSSIRKRGAVSEWLHGVAYRTAMKAKRSAARRRHHEAKLCTTTKPATASPSWEDVQAVLDEEIQRLPRPGREAFVLCVLQGQSGAEAAAELGCKEGTVKSRLNRARRTLQQRLAQRGIELGAVLAALAVGDSGRATLPTALLRTAVRLGLLSVRAGSIVGTIPKHIAALAGGSGPMLHTKGRIVIYLLLAIGLIAGGAGVLARQARKPPRSGGIPKFHTVPAQPAPLAVGPPATHEASKRIEVSGRVLGPDGHPVAGAKLFVCDEFANRLASQAPTDRAGRFHFALAPSELPIWRALVAKMDGLGADWIRLTPGEPPRGLTLHLPVDVPIDGKVVGLEGQPIAHAAVRLVQLSTSSTDTLDEFLKRWTASKEKSVFSPAYPLLFEKSLQARAALEQLASATTDSQGRFHLAGIGHGRAVLLGIRAPGMADHYVRALLRPGFQTQPGQVTLFGTRPTAVLVPAKPILGTLRDAQTKQPLAAVRVLGYTPSKPLDWSWRPIETVTDAHGHYRLDGLSKASQQVLLFDPAPGARQMHRFDEINDTPSFTAIVHDAELHRGIVVHGQVVDLATGRPVRARVVYAPLLDNRFYERTPGYRRPKNVSSWITSREMIADRDGRYRLTALPG